VDLLTADPARLPWPALAMAATLAWAVGLRLYLVVVAIGLTALARGGELPGSLTPLAHPLLLGVAGLLALVEWKVARIRGLDCLWDALHTLIRILAAAGLAVLALSPQPLALSLVTALAGALIAASAHCSKTGVRLLLHADPMSRTPRTGLSRAEEGGALALVWTGLAVPAAGLAAVTAAVAGSVWLLPRLWQRLARAHRDVRQMFEGDRLHLSGLR